MPSQSPKQHSAMEGVAHDPAFAKKVGIPQSVGKDFASADEASGKFRHNANEPHADAKTPSKGGRVKRPGY